MGAENVHPGSIIYGFHCDVLVNYITMHLLREQNKKILFIGSHDFASYTAYGPGSFGAYETWRFDRSREAKPSDQIIAMLKSRPEAILGIFTDGASGEPMRVRESLIKLAISSQRPIVPYRSLYGPKIRIGRNDYPSLLVKGQSVFGKEISWEELSALPLEAARERAELALCGLGV